jgi:ubiquinol-cytochrome c reductase iron-sulfur subunit
VKRSELAVVVLLGLTTIAAVGFIAEYALGANTQLLGIAIGGAFAFLAVAAVIVGKRLVDDEPRSEPYGTLELHEEDRQAIVEDIERTPERITRKRLLGTAAAGAGAALGAALVVPFVSLGPLLDVDALRRSPWHAGLRLVDRDGAPIPASEVITESFVTAFAPNVTHRDLGSPLIVLRVPVDELVLPSDRAGWAPHGIMAFSKICTHAGCSVAMYRAPLFAPTSPRPALVCPCHYSTFEPRTGGTVIFGPAGRPLPQLPLEIDRDGNLRAAGGFSGRIGPSWWGVRE